MNFFEGNQNFVKQDGIYCQKDFSNEEFEKVYVDIRTKEGRMYDDATVRNLPSMPEEEPLSNEWLIRGTSAWRLVKQLKKENCRSVVEVGCGNGWLTNFIHDKLEIPVYGIDIEKAELEQAVRISQGKTVFGYADIFSEAMNGIEADVVVLASCVQYFPDLKKLINRLKTIGTIHVIDSPLYSKEQVEGAKQRSLAYFQSKNVKMGNYYFHHQINALAEFNPVFLHRPSPITRFFKNYSPFPWVRIGK